MRLCREFLLKPDFNFVNIGAYDGVTYDPIAEYIRKNDWSGLFVEPIKKYLNQCRSWFNGPQFQFENSAIGSYTGLGKIWAPNENIRDLPEFAKGMSSINRKNGLGEEYWRSERSKGPKSSGLSYEKFDNAFSEQSCNFITLKDLFEKYNIQSINCMKIDAEGYDQEILEQLFKTNIRPDILIFEHSSINKPNSIKYTLSKIGYSQSDITTQNTISYHESIRKFIL